MGVRARTLAFATMTLLAFGSNTVRAQSQHAAFLSDYSKLRPAPDNPFEELYVEQDAVQHAAQYTAVMVDQPELFISPDSKYQGMKPDDMKAIADALRGQITAELQHGGYQIVDKPGPNVLYARFAVGDLLLQKKQRSILGYVPGGASGQHASSLVNQVTSRVDVKGMKVEGEVLDSTTLAQYGAMTVSRGALTVGASGKPGEAVSWVQLNELFSVIGKRLRCRLDNQKLAPSQWNKCGAIGLAAAKTG